MLRRLTLLIPSIALFYAGAMLAPLGNAAPPSSSSSGWIVILNDPPVAKRYPGRIENTRATAEPYRRQLRQLQEGMRAQIEAKNIHVTGSVQHLLNAIFVRATSAQAESLKALPGVKAILPMRRYHLNDQLTLSDVQGAWNASPIGGQGNAGKGLKIGIIDTGIDQTHPSFQDSSLRAPSGFPKCDVSSNCAFTSNKVIVARSYVSPYLTAGSNPSDPAADSRPDDTSARDLTGHGTAVSSVAAGIASSFDGVALSGVAPKAFLGNYKVFGSPEVNPTASDAGILQALDDAVTDGMDIVNLSLGGGAVTGPLDSGAICGNPSGVPCDPVAAAVETAMDNAQVIVATAAGNEGADGYQAVYGNGAPTFGTIDTPADAPSAIAAGGIENDVTYVQSIKISGSNVPSELQKIVATMSADGPEPITPLTAALIDVTKIGDSDGLFCKGVSGTPLNGAIALILRGTCTFDQKVINAQNAGAVGVIFIDNGNGIANWGGVSDTQIPAFMVQQADGQNLKSYIDSSSVAQATMDPNPNQVPASVLGYLGDSVAYFASRGPATGTNGLKPEVSAVATDFLLAAQDYDPYGILFSDTRYATADGTSFSTPMLAGAAALVKQAKPGLTPLEVKSALVNTATLSGVQNQHGSGPAAITEVGSGILQAQNSVISNVQVVPSTVSFGLLSGSLPSSQALTLSNSGSSAISLSISVAQPSGLSGTQVGVSNSSLTIQAGQTANLSASLTGTVPGAGRYEGLITVNGGSTALNIPYMFLVTDGTPYDVIPVSGSVFDGPINQTLYEGPLIIRVVDQYGAPVKNTSVQWNVTGGGGSVVFGDENTSTSTDQNGIAYATVNLGPKSGHQQFMATVNGLQFPFDVFARPVPAINANGIVDGASFTEHAVAPGSIISIFGTGLSDVQDSAFYLPLPLGLGSELGVGDFAAGSVAVSFDVPSAGIGVPGRLYYASPLQLNVQVPWELEGQSSATVKVYINFTYSAEYTLQLATYSPGIFSGYVNGQPFAAALDQNSNPVTASNPVARGTIVQLFLNGLGPVSNQPATGSPALAQPLSQTQSAPTLTIGGAAATVSFSGLAPGLVGLYQVNATVPENISAGTNAVICSIGGATSAVSELFVK